MIQELIWREFAVKLSVASVGRLLHTLGLTRSGHCTGPTNKTPKRSKVKRWKTEDFPAIRHDTKNSGAIIHFADEAGVRSNYHSGTTWAPVGRTLVVALVFSAGYPHCSYDAPTYAINRFPAEQRERVMRGSAAARYRLATSVKARPGESDATACFASRIRRSTLKVVCDMVHRRAR